MELFFPLLGLAVLYLLSWIANLYLLVQFILGVKAKRGYPAWVVLWFLTWLFFVPGIPLLYYTANRYYSSEQAAGNFCTFFVPLLWLVAFVLFRRAAAKDKHAVADAEAELEREHILDIRHRDDIWPPPPTK